MNICLIGGELDHLKPRGCACSITISQIPRSSPILRVGTGGDLTDCDALHVRHLKFVKFKSPPLSPPYPGGGWWGIILIGALYKSSKYSNRAISQLELLE